MSWKVLVPVVAVLAAVTVTVVAIQTFEEDAVVADFGEPPPSDGATLPGDLGLDVNDVAAPTDELPPRDVVIEPADWAQVAGWIARENADGRPVVVNFWASWCEPCEREIPLLNDTADEHPEIAFLGVATNDNHDDAVAAVDEFGIAFPSVRDAQFDQIAFQVGSRFLPTTVAFDRDGRMVGRVIGELNPRNLSGLLDTVR